MSIFNLKKIGRAAMGFLSGGPAGAVQAYIAPGNPAKTRNVGLDPTRNITRGTYQLGPDLSPIPATSFPGRAAPSASQFSASGFTRLAGYANTVNQQGVVTPADWFGGSGASGSFGISSLAPGMNPAWVYRHFYTKKGTLRRLKKNGQPYAIPRMNPMNPRAARRAIRRIRGARKLLMRIERSLPRARSHAPRGRAAGRQVEVIRAG